MRAWATARCERCLYAYFSRCEPSRSVNVLRADPWLRFTVPALVLARVVVLILLIGWLHPWRLNGLRVDDELTLFHDEQMLWSSSASGDASSNATDADATAPSPYTYMPWPGCTRADLNTALQNACVPPLSTFRGGCTSSGAAEAGGAAAVFTGFWVFGVMISVACVGLVYADDKRDVFAKESGCAFGCVVAPLFVLHTCMLVWGSPALDAHGAWQEVSSFCKPLERTSFGTIRPFEQATGQPLNGRCVVTEAVAVGDAIGWYNRSRYSEAEIESCSGANWNRTLLMIDLQPSPHVLRATSACLERWRRDASTLLQLVVILFFAVPFPSKGFVRDLLLQCAAVRRRLCFCCERHAHRPGNDAGAAYGLLPLDGGVANDNFEDNNNAVAAAAAGDDYVGGAGGADGAVVGYVAEAGDDSAVDALLDWVGRQQLAARRADALRGGGGAAALNDPSVAERRAIEALNAQKRELRMPRDAVCMCCVKLELAHVIHDLPRELQNVVCAYLLVHQHDVCVRVIDYAPSHAPADNNG